MKAINDGIGLSKVMNQEKMIESVSKKYEKEINDLGDKIELSTNKKTAAMKLQGLINGLRASINQLAMPGGISSFDQKKAIISSTSDLGDGTDYVKVTAGQFASLGNFDVTVKEKAVAAALTLKLGGGNGFDTENPGLDGFLDLTVKGSTRAVQITEDQNIFDIVKKINDTFSLFGDEFKAKIFDLGDGTSHIEITALNTGAGNITYLYGDAGGVNVIDPVASHTVAGRDAGIMVNGIDLPAQASNKFIDIPYKGVTIEALKKNTAPTNKQTISIEQNADGVIEALDLFRASYNNLAVFVSEQSRQVRQLDPYADPYANHKSIYSENSYLSNELILREAKGLLALVTNRRSGENLKFQSIEEIGIGLEKMPVSDDNIIVEILTLKKPEVFKKVLSDNLDDVRSLFMNNGKVKSNPLNNGAALSVTIVEKKIDSSVLGIDVPITVTFDNAGAITSMSAMVNGLDILAGLNADGTAKYKFDATNPTKVITFSGTVLDGIRLAYNPNTATPGVAENFTLNFTHGVADLALYKVNEMVNENGKDGTVALAIETIGKEVTNTEKEKNRIQEIINKSTIELQQKIDSINVAELMVSLQIDAITRILTPPS